MIKFENTRVVGWDSAISGMQNPKNGWDKMVSDWSYCCDEGLDENECVGPNGLDLMKRLAAGGTLHEPDRRMITVYVDITAPLYWWNEFNAYKVGTVANSCSTMHKITSEEFDMGSISGERLSDDNHYVMYNAPLTEDDLVISPKQLMSLTIDMLNYLIESYDNEKDQDKKKDIWYSIIQLLPSSYNQKRTVMLDYEVLAGIYEHRKNHELEWKIFCKWVEDLPWSEIITCGSKEN